MGPDTILPFPLASTETEERMLAEVDAAIALVLGGAASRVRLVGVALVDAIAAAALARAQRAGVGFSLDRTPDRVPAITVGPRRPTGS